MSKIYVISDNTSNYYLELNTNKFYTTLEKAQKALSLSENCQNKNLTVKELILDDESVDDLNIILTDTYKITWNGLVKISENYEFYCNLNSIDFTNPFEPLVKVVGLTAKQNVKNLTQSLIDNLEEKNVFFVKFQYLRKNSIYDFTILTLLAYTSQSRLNPTNKYYSNDNFIGTSHMNGFNLLLPNNFLDIDINQYIKEKISQNEQLFTDFIE
jgi:hypothetical protein